MSATKTQDLKSLIQNSIDKKFLNLENEEEQVVEGEIIEINRMQVFLDLGIYGTGIIYGREYLNAKDVIKKLKIGDIVSVKILERENEEGYVEVSLKEAKQVLVWDEALKAMENREIFELEVKEANRGGLMLEWKGILGFLPVSQLKMEHYPRVIDGNKDKIYKELKKLTGKPIKVVIIDADPKEKKLIFSEKSADIENIQKIFEKYKPGDILECEISGIVDFGLFVKIEENLEGLVHVSEVDWKLIDDLKKMFKVGDKVKVKVLEVKDGKINLSIKALKENPWLEFENKLKVGDIVKGVVIKHNKYGALVAIKDGVAGLVHASNFGSLEKLRETLELGKSYDFQITLFKPKEQKMLFSYLQPDKKNNVSSSKLN